MTAGTADFLSAVRRAALLTTEESKGVRLAFSKAGLKLTSRSPEAGEAEVNFPCKYEGADIEIGFNPQFLQFVDRSSLRPGTELVVRSRDTAADAVFIHPRNHATVTMGTAAAAKILVEPA
jgi:DNA polymerase III sliding clamp (beta) subunit (PCNA family)